MTIQNNSLYNRAWQLYDDARTYVKSYLPRQLWRQIVIAGDDWNPLTSSEDPRDALGRISSTTKSVIDRAGALGIASNQMQDRTSVIQLHPSSEIVIVPQTIAPRPAIDLAVDPQKRVEETDWKAKIDENFNCLSRKVSHFAIFFIMRW